IPDVDAFTVRLKPKALIGTPNPERIYRITGEFLADGDDHVIAQGGAVGLDSLHLTNTGYAYIAPEFMKVIQAADQTNPDILKGLHGAAKTPDMFDQTLLDIAMNDTLLNDVPPYLTEVMDLLSAVGNAMGEMHYWNPSLS